MKILMKTISILLCVAMTVVVMPVEFTARQNAIYKVQRQVEKILSENALARTAAAEEVNEFYTAEVEFVTTAVEEAPVSEEPAEVPVEEAAEEPAEAPAALSDMPEVYFEGESAETEFAYTTIDASSISITGYYGTETDLVIPESINGLTVKTIGNNAFRSTAITSVVIPATVTAIGNAAFQYCESLAEVTFSAENGAALTTIGSYAFEECYALKAMVFPEGLTTINNHAFKNCTAMAEITFPSTLTTIGQYAIEACTSLTEVSLPDSVTSMGTGVFMFCTSLAKVNYPKGLTSAGSDIFYD
ncbi:MAG: leucine-rich repeat domain-containing protein, partial [Clostridiales bacterium]|nr:leucine-rich repeat domain-containing protein [Clostridiales bacterium]